VAVNQEAVRRLALALPGTVEAPHFEAASFRVGGKIFATLPPGDELLHVFVGEPEIHAATAHDPAAFEELHWGRRLLGLRVRLARADAGLVRELLESAWRQRAPGRRGRAKG
jgi:hypothetical protein